jgi:hypothetical protein
MKRSFLFLMLVGIMVLLLSYIPNANANMIMYLDDLSTVGVYDVIIVDGGDVGTITSIGPSTIADPVADGVISYSRIAEYPDTGVDIITARSKPIVGNAFQKALVLEDFHFDRYDYQIGLTDTDFILTNQDLGISLVHEWSGVYSQRAINVGQGFLDPANVEFGQTFATPLSGPFPIDDYAETEWSDSSSSPLVDMLIEGQVFSLTQIIDISQDGIEMTMEFDSALYASSVPEPSTMLLLGFGLIGLVGFGRKKFKK